MPIYVYECPNCGKQREAFKPNRIEADHEIEICTCRRGIKQEQMRCIIAPTSFVLKGDGWAKDGYSKKETK